MRIAAACSVVIMTAAVSPAGPTSAGQGRGVDALGAIVGVWQSDVTNGVSSKSSCAWTPQHNAVVCDQAVTTPQGEQHTTNIYAFDPTANQYVFYSVNKPGDTLRPVALSISGSIWIYGGQTPDADGVTYRTVNDFTAGSSYTWRRESSRDGKTWTIVAQGRSERLK